MISLSLVFLCHYFRDAFKFVSLQRLYEIHQDYDLDCEWIRKTRKISDQDYDRSEIEQILRSSKQQQIEQTRLVKKRQEVEQARLINKRQEVEKIRFYKTYLIRQEQWERDEQARMLKKQQQRQEVEKEVRITKKQEEARLTTFACRRCFVKYSSNIKLHEHIRDHHRKKSKSVVSSSSTSSISFESTVSSKSIISLSDSSKSASQSKILSTSSSSRSVSIFSSLFTSKRVISSNISSLSSSASEFVLKRSESASFTSSSSSSQKSVTMRSTLLFKSIFATSTKFYLTINDLYIMFAKKFMRAKLFSSQNSSFSSDVFVFRQARIIVYFLFIFSASKSTKFEVFTSVYDSIKQSIRTSFSRSSSSRFSSSIRSLFSTIFYFFSVCWRCQESFVIYLSNNWFWSIVARAEISVRRRERRLFV